MIFVLPILLYPLLGYGVMRVTTAMQQKPRAVVLVGVELLPATPEPLLSAQGDGFNPSSSPPPWRLSVLIVQREPGHRAPGRSPAAEWAIRKRPGRGGDGDPARPGGPTQEGARHRYPYQYHSVDEPSEITYERLREMLDRWKRGIVAERRRDRRRPEAYTGADPGQGRGRGDGDGGRRDVRTAFSPSCWS